MHERRVTTVDVTSHARGTLQDILPLHGGPMHKQVGRIGSVRRELHGKACPFCGGRKYQLLLRSNTSPGVEGLLARCTQCQRVKELDDELGRILWM